MILKPLAPVSNEMIRAREPFIRFLDEVVEIHAKGDDELANKIENVLYTVLRGIDGLYHEQGPGVDLIDSKSGIQISCDLHNAFSYVRWQKKLGCTHCCGDVKQ